MKKVTRLPLTLALVTPPTFIQKVALALLAALTLSISLITGAGAQEAPEATITIGSVSLEGRTVVVRGTVTCTDAVTGYFQVGVYQTVPGGEAQGWEFADLRCSPGEGTPYEARIPADPDFAGEFGGGEVRVDVIYDYACRDPEGGDCRQARTSGTFTVEGPPPVGIASKSVVLTLYGTPGPDDAGKQFVTWVEGNGAGHCITGPDEYDPCEGNGTQYRENNLTQVTMGSSIEVKFTWRRYVYDIEEEDTFYRVTEVVNADMTNYAWYDFDSDTGGGGKGPVGGDVQDDQQEGEVPDNAGNTGAGGMAPRSGRPVGSIAGGVSLLLLSGYALLRRR